MAKIAKEDFFERAKLIAAQTKSNRIIRYFPESDLRCGHLGLSVVARKHKIDTSELSPGEFLVFSNKTKNKMKIYAPGNVIAYLKSPDNRRLDLRVITLIPRFFNGTDFNYSGALKELFER